MRTYIILLISSIIFSCSKKTEDENTINGLWLVDKVKVGNKEMTPVARWMKFNPDSTQTSGNGWLQHSIGTWSYKNDKLSIINLNGINDNADPFSVDLELSKMTWSREEEGQNVQVFLHRIDKIPTSDGNKLMGLWKLNEINSEKIESTKTLYIAWDNTYIKQSASGKKEYGIYKIHGHKPELQMVNYGKNPKFTFYRFLITKKSLTLENTEGDEVLVYSRIYQFSQ